MSIVKPSDIAFIEIFPPIGVARIGDSGFDLTNGKPDGDISWFLPSEIPGTDHLPPSLKGEFRDSKHRIKRQAVRFRAYAFDTDGNILGEVNADCGYQLHWTVHVTNSKGAFTEFKGILETQTEDRRNPDVQPKTEVESLDDRTDLIVDPGRKSITKVSGKETPPVQLTGVFYGSRKKSLLPDESLDVNLGELRTDEKGRLVFLGGAGYARSVSDPKRPNFQPDVISEFDSIDWVDDVCDGWVEVVARKLIRPPGDKDIPFSMRSRNKATVLSAPPNFAWGVNAPTTLYDIIENLAHKEKATWRGGKVQFYEHIWPVLQCTYAISWVNEQGYQGHGPAGKGNFLPLEHVLSSPGDSESEREERQILRTHIFQRLRKPNYEDPSQASTKFMPRMSGDNGDALEPGASLAPVSPITTFAALTEVQYSRFKEWRDGNFASDQPFWKKADGTSYSDIEAAPLHLQPWLLTLATLEHTVGDPLYPGIETYWLAKEPRIYKFSKVNPAIPPFRINYGEDEVRAGHLSRGLSLPWQSDFFQCNTHWWPSSRPDDVINILDWQKVSSGSVSERTFLEKIAPKRRKWTRGIRNTPDYPSEYFPGSTDMVQFWQKLGFVFKQTFDISAEGGTLPVFIERERLRIENQPLFTVPLAF